MTRSKTKPVSDRQTKGQKDRQTGRRTGRKTCRQTHRRRVSMQCKLCCQVCVENFGNAFKYAMVIFNTKSHARTHTNTHTHAQKQRVDSVYKSLLKFLNTSNKLKFNCCCYCCESEHFKLAKLMSHLCADKSCLLQALSQRAGLLNVYECHSK